jgi:hypothetical protein
MHPSVRMLETQVSTDNFPRPSIHILRDDDVWKVRVKNHGRADLRVESITVFGRVAGKSVELPAKCEGLPWVLSGNEKWAHIEATLDIPSLTKEEDLSVEILCSDLQKTSTYRFTRLNNGAYQFRLYNPDIIDKAVERIRTILKSNL